MKKIIKFIVLAVVCFLFVPTVSVKAVQSEEVFPPLGRQWIMGNPIGSANVGTLKNRAAAGSSVTIIPGKAHYYDRWSTNEFSVTTETGNYLGFCAEPTKTTTNGIYQVSLLENDVIETLVLTYTIPELWEKIGWEFYQTGNAYSFCHAGIGYTYTGQLTGLNASAAKGIQNLIVVVNHLIHGTAGYTNSKETELLRQYLEQYQLYVAYNQSQDIVWAERKPDVLVDLRLVKKQEQTEFVIPGATYLHQNPDGTTEEVVTDKEGAIHILNLQYGTHLLQETKAPPGYFISDTKIQFQVERDGTVTVLSESDEDAKDVLVDIQSENTSKKVILVAVQEKTVPYRLNIHKENEKGIKLEGACFALYTDKGCTVEVMRGNTDEKGVLEFADLKKDTPYYLREIKAPTGYALSTDEDGNLHTTEILVSYLPLNGEFVWHINGVAYEFDAEGTYTLTGSKDAPEVHLHVVNQVGYVLPQTGSNQGVILFVIAILILAGSIGLQIYDNRIQKRRRR